MLEGFQLHRFSSYSKTVLAWSRVLCKSEYRRWKKKKDRAGKSSLRRNSINACWSRFFKNNKKFHTKKNNTLNVLCLREISTLSTDIRKQIPGDGWGIWEKFFRLWVIILSVACLFTHWLRMKRFSNTWDLDHSLSFFYSFLSFIFSPPPSSEKTSPRTNTKR